MKHIAPFVADAWFPETKQSMKKTKKKRYIVEYGAGGGVAGCQTVNDLERYLDKNPHPDYRLVSFQHTGNFMLVWELKD